MNRYLLLIVCALVGIFFSVLCSDSAPCGSEAYLRITFRRATPLASPPLATGEQRVWCIIEYSTPRITTATAQRRAPIATHHRILNPWNDLPVAPPAGTPTPPRHE